MDMPMGETLPGDLRGDRKVRVGGAGDRGLWSTPPSPQPQGAGLPSLSIWQGLLCSRAHSQAGSQESWNSRNWPWSAGKAWHPGSTQVAAGMWVGGYTRRGEPPLKTRAVVFQITPFLKTLLESLGSSRSCRSTSSKYPLPHRVASSFSGSSFL